jgi:hypothetical protein
VADVASWGNALFSGRATGATVLNQMLRSISNTPDEDGDYLGYGIFRSTKISNTDVFIGHNGSATGYRSVMFYQPDRRMTIAILSNYAGAKLYAVAKALYEAMPEFLCGNENRKEERIQLCWKGKSLCVARPAADGFIKRGAFLGTCDVEKIKGNGNPGKNKHTSQTMAAGDHLESASATSLTVYPNPAGNQLRFHFQSAQAGAATLRLFDANGKQVALLFNKPVEKNVIQQVFFNASKLPSGLYFSRLQTGTMVKQQKVVVTH